MIVKTQDPESEARTGLERLFSAQAVPHFPTNLGPLPMATFLPKIRSGAVWIGRSGHPLASSSKTGRPRRRDKASRLLAFFCQLITWTRLLIDLGMFPKHGQAGVWGPGSFLVSYESYLTGFELLLSLLDIVKSSIPISFFLSRPRLPLDTIIPSQWLTEASRGIPMSTQLRTSRTLAARSSPRCIGVATPCILRPGTGQTDPC